jgi:hypothetical protein
MESAQTTAVGVSFVIAFSDNQLIITLHFTAPRHCQRRSIYGKAAGHNQGGSALAAHSGTAQVRKGR